MKICAALCVLTVLTGAVWSQSLDEVEPPHDLTNGIECGDCHVPFGTAPNPVPSDWITINVCWSCHEESGIAPWMNVHLSGPDTAAWCQNCHDPHQHQPVFPQWYIDSYVQTPHSGRKRLAFRDSTDFIHGAAGVYQPYDGICETCHTQTSFHRNNASGNHTHWEQHPCIACHKHENGFLPTGGYSCLDCHNVHGGSRRAVGPEFAGSGSHHPLTYNTSGNLETPQDNNCIICHLEGSDPQTYHANGSVDLNPDPDHSGSSEWRGNPGLSDGSVPLDPILTPSWWCLDCHDGSNPDPAYRLGGQTATDKSDFWSASTHNVRSPNDGAIFSSYGCYSCHRNGHTQQQQFAWNFYLDSKEENNCYGCHGGSALVSRLYGAVLENVRSAYGIPAEIAPFSKHSAEWTPSTSDGHTLCRDCHNPHRMNGVNMLCDPDNPEVVWTGTRDAFCLKCHDGNPAAAPIHEGVTVGAQVCGDCHTNHASTLPHLTKVNIATPRTCSIQPAAISMTIGQVQNFNNIVSPAYTYLTQSAVNRLVGWSYLTSTGGTAGIEYPRLDSIPLDRSIGYDPSGWGLITVTSDLNITDDISIFDVDVFAEIFHHYRGDIILILRHVETGTEVKVQEYSWSDGAVNLIFWYNSESPNGQYSNVSPRSTAESLTAFSGESTLGTWRLTIKDTWPSDNSTDPASPNFCYVHSWALSFNGGVLGMIGDGGQFTAQYAGSGQLYATLHEGPIYPNTTGGLYVSVWETNPLQASTTFSIGPVSAAPPVAQGWNQPATNHERKMELPNPGVRHQLAKESGRSCSDCHQARVAATDSRH